MLRKQKKKRLPEKYYDLEKAYTNEKSDTGKLRILRAMISLIPKGYRYNKVRSHKTHLMRLIRERIKKKKNRDEAVRRSRRFFKDGLFSIVLIGDANSGKTQLLNELCGTEHKSSIIPYETKKVLISVFEHNDVKLRVVEVPSAIKPAHAKVLREADLIIVMPGDNKRFLEFIDDFEIETPVKALKKQPTNQWRFLDLIAIKLRGEGLVLFKGATLNDLDIDKAMVNNKEKKGSYKLKDGDVVVEV